MKKDDTEDQVARSRLRAIQYQHVDGTYELTFGGAFLLMAACFYVVSLIAIPNSFFSNNLLPFAPLIVWVGGVVLIDALVQRLRARVTYPRTGYIAYRKPQPLKRTTRLVIWIGIPLLTIILLAFIFLNRPMFQQTDQDYISFLFPSFCGLLFSGLWVILGWKTSLPRFYLLALVSALVSVGLFWNGVGGNTAIALLFGAMGMVLCVSGGLTLRQYLRQNPAPQEAADEQ
jgi:hypothetical protein